MNQIISNEDTQVMVPESNLLLFADLDDYYLTPPDPATKSSQSLIPLASLLDAGGSVSVEFEGFRFTQTPFLSNREQVLFCRSGVLPEDGNPVSQDSLLYLKKFYIQRSSPDGNTSSYVVTMLTGKEYCDIMGYDDINFLNKPNYTGYIIFSATDGDVDRVYNYENGLILDSFLLKRGEQPDDSSSPTFIAPVECENIATKGKEDGENWLDEVVISAEGKIWTIYLPVVPPGRPDGRDGSPGGGIDGGGGNPTDSGKNSNTNGGGSSNNDKNKDKPLDRYYEVTAVSANPDMGYVMGGGRYQAGSAVTLSARPYYYKPRIPYALNFWSGNASGNSLFFVFTNLNGDKSACAHFCKMGEEQKPCWNGLSNVRNPLVEMSIASPGASGYKGGTFGWVRKNGTKYHNGNDFYAPEGTPVFSMCDGVVSGVDDGCPEKGKGNKYNNGTGNYIAVKDGNKEYKYAHLRHGSAIATNPRTGMPFKNGDTVYQGDIIGYTGRSGNAWDVPNPHLHLTIRVNGTPVDPAPYLNGTINVKDGRIYGIECNDE